MKEESEKADLKLNIQSMESNKGIGINDFAG